MVRSCVQTALKAATTSDPLSEAAARLRALTFDDDEDLDLDPFDAAADRLRADALPLDEPRIRRMHRVEDASAFATQLSPWRAAIVRRLERHATDGLPFAVLCLEVAEAARLVAADEDGEATRALEAAYTLFYREGIHAVGVDTIASEAGVTKTALYSNFGSKDQLVVAYLRERDRLWQQQIDRLNAQHNSPRDRALAVFDAYEDWLSQDGFRGCAFLNATAEFPDPDHPVREVVRHHKAAL